MRTYKIIKKMIQSKGLSFACVALLFFSCKKSNENTDTTPPADLTVVSVTPTSGGGIISYELPQENDLLFVRADYINAQSNEVFRVSSRENNSIEISGLVDTTPLEVTLSVVDKSQNQSEGIIVSLTPKRSFIFDVIEDISLTEDLGGVRVNWENPEEKTVFIYLYIDVNGEEEVRILSSSSKTNSKFVRGLAAVPTNFSAKVEDFDGNMTVVNELGQYTPLFEEKITKDTWALVEDLSINGNAYEGSTVYFWDDIFASSTTNSDNS